MKIEKLLRPGFNLNNIYERISDKNEASQKGKLIAEKLPLVKKEIIKEAEEVLNGNLLLPGTNGISKFVGNPPNWFAKMNDDNEFLWQLNRMTHWQVLLEAYSYTGDKRYASKVIDELVDWCKNVPLLNEDFSEKELSFFSESHPLRVLECGIRLYKTWPLIIEHLGGEELFTKEILELYIMAVYKQGEIIRRISPQLWPNADHNHYLMECMGLLTTSLMFPELLVSKEWCEFSYQELERCSEVQLTDEGGQIEGCPSYHNGCMFWFGLVILICKKHNLKVSDKFLERYKNNLNYSLHCMRPTGKTFPLGDSHANNLSIMGATYGYFVFNDIFWFNHLNLLLDEKEIKRISYNYIWHSLDVEKFIEDLDKINPLPKSDQLNLELFNKELGQSFVRSDWTPDAHAFAHTCRSPIKNLHAHIDMLSFEYIALNKNIICDPGIYTYKECRERRELKSTAAHSTLMINDKNFFEYISAWEYGPQQHGELTSLVKESKYVISKGYHKSYKPINVYREITLVENSFLVVVDKVENRQKNDTITRTFHLDFTDVETLNGRIYGYSQTVNVEMANYTNDIIILTDGKLSDSNDVYRPSKKVLFKNKKDCTEVFITVITPYYIGGKAPCMSVKKDEENVYCIYKGEDIVHQFLIE